MCSEQKMIHSYKKNSKLGNITKRKDKFIMKNINDNWDLCGKIYDDLWDAAETASVRQETQQASFLNSQIF